MRGVSASAFCGRRLNVTPVEVACADRNVASGVCQLICLVCASVSGSLTGKSILSTVRQKSICVSSHMCCIASDCALTKNTEAGGLLSLLGSASGGERNEASFIFNVAHVGLCLKML